MRKVSMKRKSKKDKAVKTQEESDVSKEEETSDSGDQVSSENGETKPKRRKSNKRVSFKAKKGAKEAESEESEEDSQYEVEAILGEKSIRGVRHFLIKWKGYEEESNTWEPESTVNCADLLKVYESNKATQISPSKKSKGKKKGKRTKSKQETPTEEDWSENENFEVDRIIEVHHKRDGSREFLVSWKGYPSSQNSWEPEDNMDCKDMIVKFMQKVEKAKEVEKPDLRMNRSHTIQFTSADSQRRRSSKRSGIKQRISYNEAD